MPVSPGRGPFTIGRSPDCDIVLADETVSRRHADLSITLSGDVVLTDRRSTQGTQILERGAWRPLARQVVSRDATVRFGDVTMAVAELLDAIREVRPPARAGSDAARQPASPVPSRAAGTADATGSRGEGSLVRCGCGAVKPRGARCAECGE